MTLESSTIISLRGATAFNLSLLFSRADWFASGYLGGFAAGREPDAEPGEAADRGRDADLSAELLDEVAHDVHAHAPSGIASNLLLRRESGDEDERQRAPVVEHGRLFCAHQAALDRGLLEFLGIEPATIVLADELETLTAAV